MARELMLIEKFYRRIFYIASRAFTKSEMNNW